MYNERVKIRFIEDGFKSVNTINHILTVFRAIEKFEILWESDVCTWDVERLGEAINSVSSLRSKSNAMILSVLKEYIMWCVKMRIPGAHDGILSIDTADIVGLEKIRKQTVSSPLQLQAYLDSLFDKENEQTLDNIYRCCCWLAYGGFEEEEIAEIRCSDVDFLEMTVIYNDKDMPIYRESLQAFRNSVALENFVYIHPNYRCVKKRIPGDKLIRGVKADMKIDTIRPVLSAKNRKALESGKTDKQLSFYRMRISGLFYRMYERERAGVPVSFRNEAIRYVKSREYTTDIPLDVRANRTEKEYFDDYQRWKIAFKI